VRLPLRDARNRTLRADITPEKIRDAVERASALKFPEESKRGDVPVGVITTIEDLRSAVFEAKTPTWSEKSIEQYTRWAEELIQFFRPATRIDRIQIPEIEAFKAWLAAQKLSSNSIIHRLEFASSVWN
jgi:hypothetical protein